MFTFIVDSSSFFFYVLNSNLLLSKFYFRFIFSILLSLGSDILIKLIEKLLVMFPILFHELEIFLLFFLGFL